MIAEALAPTAAPVAVRPPAAILAEAEAAGARVTLAADGGITVAGDLPPDLVDELAEAWRRVARHLRTPTGDPRPDLVDDAEAWAAAFTLARPVDGHDPAGLYGVLRGFRALGARLDLTTDAGGPVLQLYPWPDAGDGEALAAIGQHRDALAALLRRAGEDLAGYRHADGAPAQPVAGLCLHCGATLTEPTEAVTCGRCQAERAAQASAPAPGAERPALGQRPAIAGAGARKDAA